MEKLIWLHVVNSMRGGVGRVVENLMATGINAFEQRISVLDPGRLSPVKAAIKKISTARRAIDLLPTGSVVHLHCGLRSWVYVGSNKDLQYIATIHGILPTKGFADLKSKIELFFLSKQQVSIVAVSNHCKKTLQRMCRLCRSIIVIPNGVPKADYIMSARMDMTLNVGFVGDLSKNKGIQVFVEVAKLLIHMPIKFIVFGCGPESRMVGQAVKEGIISWIYDQKHPGKIYSQIDILVFPSWFEGCPMAILEAMSYGVTTISSDIPGVREIIENGKDGILIGSWDAHDYAAAIERLIMDTEMRRNISKLAKEKWALHFNAESMAQRYTLLSSKNS